MNNEKCFVIVLFDSFLDNVTNETVTLLIWN